MIRRILFGVFCCELVFAAWLNTASGAELGANKFDLSLQ